MQTSRLNQNKLRKNDNLLVEVRRFSISDIQPPKPSKSPQVKKKPVEHVYEEIDDTFREKIKRNIKPSSCTIS